MAWEPMLTGSLTLVAPFFAQALTAEKQEEAKEQMEHRETTPACQHVSHEARVAEFAEVAWDRAEARDRNTSRALEHCSPASFCASGKFLPIDCNTEDIHYVWKLSSFSGKFSGLSGKFSRLSGKFSILSGKFSRLSGKFPRLSEKFSDCLESFHFYLGSF